LVVRGQKPEISFEEEPNLRRQAQEPGPGLGLQAPSVERVTMGREGEKGIWS
jgi:hypothetical protein